MAVTLGDGNITFANGSTMNAPSLGESDYPTNITRYVNIIYTNTSSKLLFVNINCGTNSGTNSFRVGGVEVAQNSSASRWNIAFIVPPGLTYEYQAPGGTNTIYWWTECY
jgi:hypothetical protein